MIIHLWESLINCMIRKNERIGGEDDKEILTENGFDDICFKEDLCGIIRVVKGRKK